jgi:fimbrial isopeptide formation D2 family protein
MRKKKTTAIIAIALAALMAFPSAVFAIGVPTTPLPGSGSYGGTFGSSGVYTSWEAPMNAFKVKDTQYTITMQDVSGTTFERVAKTTNLPSSIANSLGAFDTQEKRDRLWQFSTVGDNAVASGDTLMWIRHAAVRNIATQDWDYIDVKISLRSFENGASGNNTIAVKKSVRTSVEIYNMKEAFLQWDFYYEGTTKKYTYKSNVTFSDIDIDQHLGVRASDVVKVFADKDTNLKYNKIASSSGTDYHMFAGTVVTESDHQEDAIGYLVNTDSLKMVFGRASGAGHAHFGYYMYSMMPNPSPEITKTVSDADEEDVDANTLTSRKQAFRYELETTVPSGTYKAFDSFEITDPIDRCLQIDKIVVKHQSTSDEDCVWTKEDGADTADADHWFDIKVSSANKVTVSAKNAALNIKSNAAFYGGATRESRWVTVTIHCHISPDVSFAQLVAHGHRLNQEALRVENDGRVDIGNEYDESNTVTTDFPFPQPPEPPTKDVSDLDESHVDSNRLATKTEAFTYRVAQKIPSAYGDSEYYTGFRIRDQIDTCLQITGVTVTQKGKGDRTAWFDITTASNNVIATAKPAALADEDFCSAATAFYLNVAVRIDPAKEAALATHGGGTGHYNAAGDILTFANKAATDIATAFSTYAQDSNATTTRVAIPKKNVSDSDEQKVTADRIINANEPFTYRVRQAILDGLDGEAKKYASFVLSDEMDSCVKPVTAKVVRDDGSDAGSLFDISVSGSRITAAAKASALETAAFYGSGNGVAYTLLIEAALDQSKTVAELKAHGHYSPVYDEMTFPNRGVATIGGVPMTSNEVTTKVGVPDLSIAKSASRYEHQVNDRVRYTITVRHTAKSTSDATSVVIKDVSMPDGFDVDMASLKVSGIATKNHSFEAARGGFVFKADVIAMGETAVITFDAIPSGKVNGTIVDNTASVTAYSMLEEKTASASVYINSPKLDIAKMTHRAEYKVGETIPYILTLTQRNHGTFMRNVVIADCVETEGVTLLPGSIQALDSNGRIITHLCDVTVSGNAFTIATHLDMGHKDGIIPPKEAGVAPYGSLDPESRIIVTYGVTVDDPGLAGGIVKNAAVAPSRPNTYGELIKDDENIPSGGGRDEHDTPIVGAKLKIEKSSDKETYRASETARYTLKVTQAREDYTARNVTVRDALDTTLAAISDGSVKVTLNKKDITSGCAIEASGAALEVRTNRDLEWGDTLVVTYDVSFADGIEEDTEIPNAAVAGADNAPEAEDENTVTVIPDGEPELGVDKSSDKETYRASETARYTLIVTQKTEGCTARNVTVRDELGTTLAAIARDSVKVALNGEDITSGCALTVSGTAFEIQTGSDLAWGDLLVVTYDVAFPAGISGVAKIPNTAIAGADNAIEATGENEITVSPDEPGPQEPTPPAIEVPTPPAVTPTPPAIVEPKPTPPAVEQPTPAAVEDGPKGHSPKTGDDFNPALFAVIALIGASGIAGCFACRRRMLAKARADR